MNNLNIKLVHELKVKLLSPHAKAPVYSTEGAAGLDFFVPDDFEPKQVHQYQSVVVPLGVAVEIPVDWALMLMSRSGHGFKYAVRLANSVGLIDSDYRGELMVKITCDQGDGMMIKAGDKICQGVLVHTPQFAVQIVDELSDTERGAGGFGSTDVDFMQRWCDEAPSHVITLVMNDNGKIHGYQCRGDRLGALIWNWHVIDSLGGDPSCVIGISEENKHLWRESKRVRTDKGWVKA